MMRMARMRSSCLNWVPVMIGRRLRPVHAPGPGPHPAFVPVLTRAFMVPCGARRAATSLERAQLARKAVVDRVRRGAVPERQRLGIVGFAPDERSTRLAG